MNNQSPRDPSKSWTVSESLELDAPDLSNISDLRFHISEALSDEKFPIPPLPTVLAELNNILSRSDPDLRKACSLLERDAALAGQALKIASSAAFGSIPAKDLGSAVVRIGSNGLRDIVFSLFIGRIFKGKGKFCPMMKAESARNFPLARLSQAIFHITKLDHQFGFLAGLLADIGRIALIAVLSDTAQKGIKLPPSVNVIIDDMHTDVGALIISRWKLEPSLRDVARAHHDPERANGSKKMPQAVHAADYILSSIETLDPKLQHPNEEIDHDLLDSIIDNNAIKDANIPLDKIWALIDLGKQALFESKEKIHNLKC